MSCDHCPECDWPEKNLLEVTRRMVGAGVAALASYDPNDDFVDRMSAEEAVKRVWQAMVGARKAADPLEIGA